MLTATFKDEVMSKLEGYVKADDIAKLREFSEAHHPDVPDGLEYVDGWLDIKGRRVFELIKTNDESLIKTWTKQLEDLFELDITQVVSVPTPRNNKA